MPAAPFPEGPPDADPRAGHADLMDQVYRHQRYIYDFTRKYYLFGRDRLIDELGLGAGERVVEVGCGTARNLVAMARRYPAADFYGLDASRAMLQTAARNVRRAGLEHRIRLAHGFAEGLTPSLFGLDQPFDRVVFSYSLSMIPDWHQALKSADAALGAGGRLHAVDFGDLSGFGRTGAGAMRRWLALFHVEPRIELLRDIEAALSRKKPRADSVLSTLPGRYAFVLNCSKRAISALGI